MDGQSLAARSVSLRDSDFNWYVSRTFESIWTLTLADCDRVFLIWYFVSVVL